jgi:hypothetical protein
VPEPELYNWYSTQQAISFFGSPDEAQHLCNGQRVILPGTAICLTNIEERRPAPRSKQKSYFANGAKFCWVADQPYELSNEPLAHFMPTQVSVSGGKKYSKRLFAPAAGEDQSQPTLRRPKRWHQTGQRRDLVGQLMDYDLGYLDHQTCRLEPIENPFGPKVLPMSPE